MSWKDLKIAKKLYTGFGIVLVLAIAIGWVGYSGISTVSEKVANANDANELVKQVKDMGVQRVSYASDRDETRYQTVTKMTDDMIVLLDQMTTRFSTQEDLSLAKAVRTKIDEYRAGWAEWVATSKDMAKAMTDITADANVVQPKFFALREAQRKALEQAVKSGAGRQQMQTRVTRSEAANDMLASWLDMRVAYRNYRLLNDKSYSKQMQDFLQRCVDLAGTTQASTNDQAEQTELAAIGTSCTRIINSMNDVVAKNDEAKVVEEKLKATAGQFVAAIDEVRKSQQNQMASAQSSAVTMAVAFVIGAVIFGAFIAFFIARGISKPVSNMAEIAQEIATGDIQKDVELHSKDEIGQLASSFRQLIAYMKELAGAAERIAANDLTVEVAPKSDKDVLGNSFKTMTGNLTGMIRQLGQNADELVTAATEIASSAEEMSRGANDQNEQMGQVSSAIEEMTATIVESSKNAAEASDGARGASDTASSGGKVVSETVQGMQRIANVVRESAESIQKLATSADQIGEIIGVIDDIADQTNLLALNAAIEAARAGEQGRGFAVVADEVRKLAERTGKATGEITDMIKGIQNDTQEAVHSMETGIQEVDKGRELADQAGNSLTEVVSGSQRVMDMIQQIATASEEQSVAAEQISKNIEHIASITKETASGAEQSATAAEELNRQAEGLRQMVGRFKVRTS
jgi:methyl-accepting chemotaxis protein